MSRINRTHLLASIAKSYRDNFRKDKKARAFARSLGLSDERVLERYEVGYSNGTLPAKVPSQGEIRDVLEEIGLLSKNGEEMAKGCLIVPALDRRENVAGFIGIGAQGQEYWFCSEGPYIYGHHDAYRDKEIIFVAKAREMLKLAAAGFKNAVPVQPEFSDEALAFMRDGGPRKAYLGAEFDNLTSLLQKQEVACFFLDVHAPGDKKKMAKAIESAAPIPVRLGPDAQVKVNDEVLCFLIGKRYYEVRELDLNEWERMRVLIRAIDETEKPSHFYMDTVDLFSGRNRASFSRAAASLYQVVPPVIESDLSVIIGKIETMRHMRVHEDQTDYRHGRAMSEDEREDGLKYLKAPNLMDRIVADITRLGYVGEAVNKKLGYLIALSRKLASPLCGVVISRASAGKSRLIEVLSEMVPPDDLVSYTRITPQALYYADERSFTHKLVVSAEDEGLLGSDYALRELISSKRIKLAAPVKDAASGKMKMAEYEVEGPIALLFTTTKPSIHYENATRCFTLSLDESADQTQEIHLAQRRARMAAHMEGESELVELKYLHQNVQKLLQPCRVVNPYAMDLTFPTNPLEMRREHEKYLGLIDAIALLHQYQRVQKEAPAGARARSYVEVAIDDIEEANRLMTEILGTRSDELARPSRELLKLIRRMVDDKAREIETDPRAVRFNRRDIRVHTGWSDNQIKAHIRQLEELEYLLVSKGERGRMYRYELAYEGEHAEKKRLLGLTDTAKLRAAYGENGAAANKRDSLRLAVGKLGMVGHGWAGPLGSGSAEKTNGNGSESWKVGRNQERTKGTKRTIRQAAPGETE